MKLSEQFILNILKKSLFDLEISEHKLEAIDWKGVFLEAKHHTVLPLVLQEIVSSSKEYKVEESVLKRWKAAVSYQVATNHKLMYWQDRVIELLEKSDIPYAVLKGTSVSCCYKKPELRVLGDIDLLFNASDCQKATDLLCENGYENLNLNLAIHEAVQQKGVRIEPHYMVAEIPDNKAGENIKAFFADALDWVEAEKIIPYSFNVLSPRHQFVALLLHMERHLSHDGIGLRQLSDWAMFINARINNELWENQVKPVLKTFGLLKFAQVITKVCVLYLGLDSVKFNWCMEADDKLCTGIMLSILRSGNMGRKASDNVMVRRLSASESEHNSVFRNFFFHICFLANRDFPICKKFPFILPLVWLYIPIRQVFRIIMGKRKKQIVLKTFHEAKKQQNIYKDLRLYVTD